MPRRKKAPTSSARNAGGIKIHNAPNDLGRVKTGLWSLDRAIGGGLPLRSPLELSGWEFSGKSTLALYLCGAAHPTGQIAIADIEPIQDPLYLVRALGQSGFQGEVRFMSSVDGSHKPVTAEAMLEELANSLYDTKTSALLLDSIGALYPVSEEEGLIGEGRVGRRAQIMADFMRKISQRLRSIEQNAVVVMTNHLHPLIGSQGTATSGGKAVHALSTTRLRLNTVKEKTFWLVQGRVIKRRFWGDAPPDEFETILLPGTGIHPGWSAVQDCVTHKLAEKTDGRIVMHGKKYGYFSQMGDKPPEFFRPFQEELDKWK